MDLLIFWNITFNRDSFWNVSSQQSGKFKPNRCISLRIKNLRKAVPVIGGSLFDFSENGK